MAVGATMMGMEILNPSTVVLRSTLVTSTRMRGRNLQVVEKSTKGIKVQEISQDCTTIVVVECNKREKEMMPTVSWCAQETRETLRASFALDHSRKLRCKVDSVMFTERG